MAGFLSLSLIAAGCSSNGGSGTQQSVAQYRTINAAQAKEKIDSDSSTIVLDVRTLEEYAEAHVPGSKLIPYDQIGSRAATELPDKNAVIIVYCRSGNRSGIAARKLVSMGYTGVYDMGGLYNWRYQVETGAPK